MLWFFWTLQVLLQRWCLTCHCVHTLTPRGNRERTESGIYFKIFEKTQYLMNTLYIRHMSDICPGSNVRHISFLGFHLRQIRKKGGRKFCLVGRPTICTSQWKIYLEHFRMLYSSKCYKTSTCPLLMKLLAYWYTVKHYPNWARDIYCRRQLALPPFWQPIAMLALG